jgi:hypothetical protein
MNKQISCRKILQCTVEVGPKRSDLRHTDHPLMSAILQPALRVALVVAGNERRRLHYEMEPLSRHCVDR